MSGNYSRNKGRRNEYLLRDYLRTQGFTAERVPLSGASRGFKGDILAQRDGKAYVFELKTRADSYGVLYNHIMESTCLIISNDCTELVKAGLSLNAVLSESPEDSYTHHAQPRVTRKLCSLKKLLAGSDILVIKDDRKPFIFLRYS